MTRYLPFALLLWLAAGVALAGETPGGEDDARPAETPVPKTAEASTPKAKTSEAQASGAKTSVPQTSEAKTPEAQKSGAKMVPGMSILGNQEAPKSLVIVPWKGSELGDSLGISTMLDDSRRPVDKEVFLRALSYYEIRSKTAP